MALFLCRIKWEHSRLASQVCLPILGNGKRLCSKAEVYDEHESRNSLAFFFLLQSFWRVGLLARLECVQGLRWSGLLILMSFSGPFNLVSGGFMAAPPLISNSLNLPFGTQRRPWRLESCLQEIEEKSPPHPGIPQGPAQHHFCSLSRIFEIYKCSSIRSRFGLH